LTTVLWGFSKSKVPIASVLKEGFLKGSAVSNQP